ncbi:hypothetical protein KCP69_25900 [Salmonella enterica subsp. enterica]|nr:hypothetical protein KCP69_25900 [Salmonella enterica subsp. enterica]
MAPVGSPVTWRRAKDQLAALLIEFCEEESACHDHGQTIFANVGSAGKELPPRFYAHINCLINSFLGEVNYQYVPLSYIK